MRVVLIGAGSVVFAKTLLSDIHGVERAAREEEIRRLVDELLAAEREDLPQFARS